MSDSNKIHSLFLSYQDLQSEVRKLKEEVDVKKVKKSNKEKELTLIESKTRELDNDLHSAKNHMSELVDLNKSLKNKAEKERVEQYAVYLELLAAEESIKALEKQKFEDKAMYSTQLRAMARDQFQKREEIKAKLFAGDIVSNDVTVPEEQTSATVSSVEEMVVE